MRERAGAGGAGGPENKLPVCVARGKVSAAAPPSVLHTEALTALRASGAAARRSRGGWGWRGTCARPGPGCSLRSVAPAASARAPPCPALTSR
eukprot:888985-Rhodomonas_salina.1